jgi:hypothetical protein
MSVYTREQAKAILLARIRAIETADGFYYARDKLIKWMAHDAVLATGGAPRGFYSAPLIDPMTDLEIEKEILDEYERKGTFKE